MSTDAAAKATITRHAHRAPTHHHVRRATRWLSRHLLDRFLLLPIGAAIALVWANSAAESYFTFAQTLSFPVNEIGMAFFFALVTQEIVEAVMPGGALHTWRRWGLPVVAAVGGIVGSVGVYLAYVLFQYEHVLTTAWPIASAIDIAAAYYLLKSIMPRSGALPFALIVGIATDTFGIFVVAPRY